MPAELRNPGTLPGVAAAGAAQATSLPAQQQRAHAQASSLQRWMSLGVGWLADCELPRALRAPVFKSYARATGASIEEARGPLEIYPSLGAFFVRRLRDGARPFPSDPRAFPCPCDGRVQTLAPIQAGATIQAKGRSYALEELLGTPPEERAELAKLEGGLALTIYLSPRDYHRVHSPLDAELVALRWRAGALHSVAPKVLARRPKVLSINERCVLWLHAQHTRFALVMVGALNVGRIRVVGASSSLEGALQTPLHFARGHELARFEMGSTIVLCLPPGHLIPRPDLAAGMALRLGESLGQLAT